MLVICRPRSDRDFKALHEIMKNLPASNPMIKFAGAPGDAALFVKEGVKRKEEVIVVIGGDNTISEILPIIMTGETKLAIIPIGRGNEIARHFKVPRKLRLAIKTIIECRYKDIDVIKVRGEYFLRNFKLGPATSEIESETMRFIDGIAKKFSFEPFLFSLHENGKEIYEGKILQFEVISRPGDGLEINLALSKIESFGFNPQNHRTKNGQIVFSNDRDLVASVDGRSFFLPKGKHEIETIPKAIRLIQVS